MDELHRMNNALVSFESRLKTVKSRCIPRAHAQLHLEHHLGNELMVESEPPTQGRALERKFQMVTPRRLNYRGEGGEEKAEHRVQPENEDRLVVYRSELGRALNKDTSFLAIVELRRGKFYELMNRYRGQM